MKIIAPSILSADFSNLSQQIKAVELGGAGLIHCDVMDGHFVPNITFGPLIVNAAKKVSSVPLDVHLMIENPDNYIEDFVKAGADYLTVHQEAAVHLNRTISLIKDLGCKAGVSINPSTPVETLSEILPFVDLVLIMSVNPGFGGQKFIPQTLTKVEKLFNLRKYNGYNYLIEIDGGVSSSNIKEISKSGVDIFVAGSAVFNADNITEKVEELKNLVSGE